jgi:RNA polymerase sigma-B factor
MLDFSHHQRLRGALEDLDETATAYAHEWTDASGDLRRQLRADLICHCLPFANRLALRYCHRGEPTDDLQQIAQLGLINAVDRFDPDRGSFTAFAVISIRGEIKRHFRDKTWGVHVTRRMQDLALDLHHTTAALTTTLARQPSDLELATSLQVPEEQIRLARICSAGHTPVPLSTPVGTDGSQQLADIVGAPDDALEGLADKLAVTRLLRQLPERIERMMMMRFYGGLNQAEIATEFGISQMQVSRLLARGLSWLRAAMLSDVPPRWIGAEHPHGLDDLVVQVHRGPDAVIAVVRGEVDRDTADRFRIRLHTAVAEAAGGRLIIDATGMPLIDAAGTVILRDACVAARLAGVTVTLIGMQPLVRTTLTVLGMPMTAAR